MTTTYKIIGVTDERNECDCCGRTHLKRTVVVSVTADDGSRVDYYGTNCAARIAGMKAKEVEAAIERLSLAAQLKTLTAEILKLENGARLSVDVRTTRATLLASESTAAEVEAAERAAYAILRFWARRLGKAA